MTVPSDGMFGPLNEDELREAERAAPTSKDADPRPIVPAPADAPDPDWRRLRPLKAKGDPVGTWTYLTVDDEVAFHVARWENEDSHGRKVIRPAAWTGVEWVLKAMPDARPLYNLPAILESPDKLLVVVEGEKCADAAADAFPEAVVTTWQGGSGAWRLTDWEPLAGRDVLLVADTDDSGRKAIRQIAEHLASMECTARVHLPSGDDGRDIADWLEEESVEATRKRIAAEARVWEPEAATVSDAGATETDDEAIARLAALPELEYERVRKGEARRLGMRTALLDKLVRKERSGSGGDHLQGRPIEWNDPVPWPKPVDGAALLTDIAGLIRRYVDMPGEKADAVALWIVHTFLHSRLDVSTILVVTSATKRCGKTLLMEVVATLALRSVPVSGRITPAGTFRLIELHEPTLFLDEADTYMGNDSELRGILNGSHSRDSAFTIRTVGDDYEPRCFSTWCPKAISGIGDLPDTVADRAVTIRLQRRSTTVGEMPHWRDRDRQAVEVLRQKLARWTDDNADAVLERRKTGSFPSGLHERARDIWEALLAIAEFAGGNWAGTTGRAYRACEAINAEVDPENGVCEMLLADMRKVFKEAGNPETLPTGKPDEQYDPNKPATLPALIAMEGRPWSEWSRGRPLSPRSLASLLKGFDIAPGTIRLQSGSTPKGYKRAAFVPQWQRYGIDTPEASSHLSATTPQPRVEANSGHFLSATSPHDVADTKTPKPASSKTCGVVADRKPTVACENTDNRDPNAFRDIVADADERAAILEFEGEVPKADAERMAECQFGLESGTLVNVGTKP